MKNKLSILSITMVMALTGCISVKEKSEQTSSEQSSVSENSETSSISSKEDASSEGVSSEDTTSEEQTSETTSEQSSTSDDSTSSGGSDEEVPISFDFSNQDYLDFFNPENNVEITINITNERIYKLAQYGVDSWSRQEMYHPCDVIISINGEERFNDTEVGLRMKGNTSKNPNFVDEKGHFAGLSHYKMAFNKTFDNEEDNDYYIRTWEDSAALKKRKKRRFGDMKKFDLKWNRNDDYTFTKEAYSKYCYRDAGVLAQNINLVKLTVNTESDSITQIYEAIECIDSNMLDKYYGNVGGSDGNLYKGLYARANLTTDSIKGNNLDPESPSNTYPTYPLKTNDDGPEFDHSLMQNFVSEINKKNVSAEKMEALLPTIAEVDNIIRYCAVAWVVGNPDDLRNNSNNTYFYFNSVNNHFSIIPYDDDRCFGILKDWPVDMSTLPADSTRMQGKSANQNGNKYWLDNPLLWRIVCQDSSHSTYPMVESFHERFCDYVSEFANKYLDVSLFKEFTNKFYNAPGHDITYAGEGNQTFEEYASSKLNNMFKA